MSTAYFKGKKEKNLYENLKKGITSVLTNTERKDIEILSILEKLGYPLNELGTYLYKDVIIEVCDILSKENLSQEIKEQLKLSLNDCFNTLYLWIASDDKELGCKTFHRLINRAIDLIDEDKADSVLASKIYGNKKEVNYGEGALDIANYYLGINIYPSNMNYQIPKTKKLLKDK